MSAAGTRVQAEKGIEDTPDLHFADLMRISRGTVKPDLARLAVDNAADTLHWLLDNGLELEPHHPIIHYGHEPYSIPRTYWAPEGGMAILEVLRPLVEDAVGKGGLTVWTCARMTRFLEDDSGALKGIRVDREDTAEEVGAKAVVLATGGYSANPDIFPSLSNGYPLHGGGYSYARGDGLKAAQALGARVSGGEKFLPTFAGVAEPEAPGGVTFSTQTYPQFRQPWELYVDKSGRRFVREDEPSVDIRERALAAIPEMRFWAIYDARIAREAPSFFLFDEAEVARRFRENRSYAEAASIADLAQVIGCDMVVLADTLEKYNAAIRSGCEDPMGREHRPRPICEPPFYAVEHVGWSIVSFAGLDIDTEMRVLRTSGEPIPSLYAAGEAIGFGSTSGNSFAGGMSVTPAMTFGRLLGTRLGKQHRAQAAVK
jgi:fumarate reductase flavoprotein subunit